MMNLVNRYWINRKGSVAVEAALLLPFLLAAGLGGLDASNMLLQNHRLENQLSIASAYLSKSDDPVAREIMAKNLAVTGRMDGNGPALISGWTQSNISISYIDTINTEMNDGQFFYRGDAILKTVQITSTINYQGFGVLSSIIPDGIVLKAGVQERVVGGGL